MSLRRTTAASAMLGFAVLTITACTDQVGGQANPSTSSGTTAPSTTTANSTTPLAGMSPCKTLNQALAGLAFPTATPSIANEKQACSSQKIDSATGKGVNVGLALQDGQRFDENITNPSKTSTGSVNKRVATEEREPQGSPGQCEIHIEVKPTSRAIVLISAGSDTDNACKIAEDYAAKVEPLLPKNT